MSPRLARRSLATLSGALVLACADPGSQSVGPDGLDIQARRTHANRNSLVTVTVSSAILNGTATDRYADLHSGGGSSIDNVSLTVSENDCSLWGELAGKMGILDLEGEQSAEFVFPVPVGSPRWRIDFSGGSVTAGIWPPAINESTTLTFTAWQLVQESPKGKKSTVGCPVSGSESSTITVEKTGEL